MALLNPPEVMPDVVRMLTETVAAKGPVSADGLLERTSPGAVGGEKSLAAKASLRAARTLGLVTKEGNDLLANDDVVARTRNADTLRPAWPRLLLRALREHSTFDDAVSASLVREDTDTPGVRDLAYALTWFHAQDRYGLPLQWTIGSGRREVESLQAEQLGSGESTRAVYPLMNDTRWNAFARWALSMHAATLSPAGTGAGSLVPDPSGLVRMVISDAIAEGSLPEVTPVLDVCDHIAAQVPFLWRGALRRQLAEHLERDPDPAIARDGIDSGISAALLQMQARRELIILDQADASYRSVLDATGRGRIGATHIQFTEVGAST